MKSTTALVAAILALVVAACGGASDEVGGGDAPKAAGGAEASKLALVAYAVPKVGFDKVIPLFTQTPEGEGVVLQPVLRRVRRPVAQGRVRPRHRRRQLLRRARRHAPREGRPGRRELEPERAQGHPVRLGRHDRHPQGQPEEHQDLGRPAQGRRRGRHAQPVQLGQREVEPARALRREVQRRPEPRGRPRLPGQADRRPHQGPAEVRPRGDRDLPAGHRRRAALLRERGAVRRAQRRGRRAHQPAGHVQDREPGRGPQQLQEPGEGEGVRGLPLHARGPEGVGRGRLPPGRSDRRAGVRRPTSRSRRSSTRSTTSAAGARSTTSSSSPRPAPWPRSTTRRRARWQPSRSPKKRSRARSDHRRRRAPRARRRLAVAEHHRPAAAGGGLREVARGRPGRADRRHHRARGPRRADHHRLASAPSSR